MVREVFNLSDEEYLVYSICNLYKQNGYRKYSMAKFEQYDLYSEHKSFLGNEGIISFTDATGRLMALRPDITMSIAKNVSNEIVEEKYYYDEYVYRLDKTSPECKEIRQVGLEYIGGNDIFSEYEVISLAAESLSFLERNFIIDISHMKFIAHVLDLFELSSYQRKEILSLIEQKSTHELERILDKFNIVEGREVLFKLINLSGKFESVIKKIEEMDCSKEMLEVVEDLKTLYYLLKDNGLSDKIFLDFTVSSDTEYYNGIIFRGYVDGAPDYVLSGGRYDRLMDKFGKTQSALGFALYITNLKRLLYDKGRNLGTKTVLVYDKSEPKIVAKYKKELMDKHKQVLVLRELHNPDEFENIYKISENGDLEVIK